MLKIKIDKNISNLKKFKECIIIIDEISEKYLKNIVIDETTKFLKITSNINKDVLKFSKYVIGFGTGKTLDFVKYISYEIKKDFILIPTSLSSDVAFTPTISIKRKKSVNSIFYKLPKLIIINKKITFSSSKDTIKAGLCDALAKFVALKDWEIANEKIKEEINEKSYKYSLKCAKIAYRNFNKVINGKIKFLVKSFKYSGISAYLAKSSRPISGSEHNFSHSIDLFSSKKSLHGYQVGLGSIIMRNLQVGYDDLNFLEIFKENKIPTNYKEIGIPKKDILNCFLKSKYIRKRYTILNTIRITKNFAKNLLKKLKII